MENNKKPDKNVSVTSLNDNSELSILNMKKRESTNMPGFVHTRTNQTDQKYSIATTTNEGKHVVLQENGQTKIITMTKSDAQSLEHGSSLANTEKELSPTSPLRKMMGTLQKVGKNIGSGIGSLGNKSLNMIGKNLGSLSSVMKLKEIGKGLGSMGKNGLKGLNHLSKGLGLDLLGKGINNLSKLGLDQLGKGLKDLGKGLNLRNLQENLKKMA